MLSGGDAFNMIPRMAKITGTVRTLDEDVRNFVEERIAIVATAVGGRRSGRRREVDYQRGYPVTVNAARADRLCGVAWRATWSAASGSRTMPTPTMGGEDFSYMLQARPGATSSSAMATRSELHTDTYDFNDEIIPVGVSYWVRLVESASRRSPA